MLLQSTKLPFTHTNKGYQQMKTHQELPQSDWMKSPMSLDKLCCCSSPIQTKDGAKLQQKQK